ncbi:hypothetical protein [Neobacillus mesonae]|uniref:hypothetical protein n=1 Tax=Neobacillus mesonae TaxID=1193713 RepID=UPI000835FA9E|nr:hypothetical protein [Neobacillus mesonae]
MSNLIIRKLTATFFTTTFISMLFSIITVNTTAEIVYNKGEHFVGWFFIFFMYIGAIILIYGNLVSIGIEYIQRRYFQQNDLLYIVIVGLFGLANGVFFQERTLAIYGMLAAVLYGVIDKWLSRKKRRGVIVLLPIALLLLIWGYFHLTSPPMPPFTKEDAVAFATSGEGTVINEFPKKIGKWEENINGYLITKETTAKEIENEIYIVTFSESWKKGTEKGKWQLAYKVERGSLSGIGGKGSLPPYYNKN